MSFQGYKDRFANIAVGPAKVFTFNTEDDVASAGAGLGYFNTSNCPGLSAGDIIFLRQHTYQAAASRVAICFLTTVTSAGVSWTINGDMP